MAPLLAHKIGSLLFCPTCGTLLSVPQDGEDTVTCEQCAHVEPASSYEDIEITTRSHPEAFPSALRQKRKTQTKQHKKGDQGTLVSEKCPSCGHLEAYSKELQLRSADEGSTIFYSCASCKHGWRVNN
ncbi:DNA-directed RNA polymerase I subunit RPA12 [Hypsizygus marmoreus]|uniref:DNA-directed RNA polymerase subunit n=1 Tax=Hypsizygus marmoreus TaxID=39966 RepID=A0A369J4R4_HYPMA|nr:DNA-directed RNA polymerase I subunit RPA12 [Hypsizygus marmoreus]